MDPLKEEIERAERTLELWLRVCGEMEDGKPWEQIDNGMRSGLPKFGPGAWRAYMHARMIHLLQEVVHVYRSNGQSTRGT